MIIYIVVFQNRLESTLIKKIACSIPPGLLYTILISMKLTETIKKITKFNFNSVHGDGKQCRYETSSYRNTLQLIGYDWIQTCKVYRSDKMLFHEAISQSPHQYFTLYTSVNFVSYLKSNESEFRKYNLLNKFLSIIFKFYDYISAYFMVSLLYNYYTSNKILLSNAFKTEF